MIFLRLLLIVLLFPFMLVLRALGFGRRDIAHVPDDDPEMAEAIAKARATLPEFRRLMAAANPAQSAFTVKAKFPTSSGGEHCWIEKLEPRGSGFVGQLANQPAGINGLTLGSAVDISEDMITDWSYNEAGVHHGHYTTKVLLPRMSKRMREQVESVYGWRKNPVV